MAKKRSKPRKSAPARKPPVKRIPWGVLAAPIAIVAGGLALLGYFAWDVDVTSGRMNQEADQWAVAYWRKPIPPQGTAPESFIPQARSLQPEDCGICHPAQFADWRESLHAHAMSPGVVGQFPSMHAAEVNECRTCHAPMTEQYRMVAGGGGDLRPNPLYDDELAAEGLACSVCHLRGHRRHGPPLAPGKTSASQLAHGEPLRTPFFEASEFCKGCHQHPTTSMKVNGKTVENTYNEWLDSPYAAQGVTCQQCHMPERRHLWRGIHDPEMTRSGVTIESEVTPEAPAPGQPIEARLILTNSGTGHAFPTYTTPAVFLRAAFKDADGQFLRDGEGRLLYYAEQILQRRLDMSVYPWGEEFDTRVLPGESASLTFRETVPPEARSLELWVWVDPDHFYNGFFRARLRNGADFEGAGQLQRALQITVDRRYLLWSRTIPVPPAN